MFLKFTNLMQKNYYKKKIVQFDFILMKQIKGVM